MLLTKKFLIIFVFLLVQLIETLAQGIVPNGWENTKLIRELDLQHTFTVESFQLSIKNVADEPLKQYYISIPEQLKSKLSTITASLSKNTDALLNCYISNGLSTLEDGTVLSYGVVELPSPIQPGKAIDIVVKIFYNIAGVPYPSKIKLGDVQQLRFTTNRLPLSPYLTLESYLIVKTKNEVEEDNKPEDVSLQGTFNEDSRILEFGPWYDIQPNTESNLELIYKHVPSLKEVVNLQRDIWVAHWASTIQFEEYYELTNKGVGLKDGFSRLEYMKQGQLAQLGMIPWIHVLEMHLPEEATEHFCTDKVGMVSTTDIVGDTFYVKPRFPIFGGWFYNFTIGWTNSLNQFLRKYENDNEVFILAVPLLNGPLDTVYDNANVTIYLPEGAEILEADSPVSYQSMSTSNKYSYFDMREGHVALTFEFKNLFTNIGKADLLVKYKYSKTALYKKPLSIAVYFFTAMMGFFIIRSLNLSINN